MIVVLTVKKSKEEKIFKRILSFILGNKITFEKKSLRSIKILYVSVTEQNKKVPWKKISKILKNKTCDILCNENIQVPSSYDFFRYNSTSLQEEFCKNAVINGLKSSKIDPDKLIVTLFDPIGKHSEILKKLILFSNQVFVITYNQKKYLKFQEKIMNEYGASIVVSDDLNWLFKSQVVLAPSKITIGLPTGQNCLIFTSEKSSVPLKGIIYHDYKIDVPKVFENMIPTDLNPEYFLSAVYDKYNVYQLSKLIPVVCLSEKREVPIEKVSKELLGRCEFI